MQLGHDVGRRGSLVGVHQGHVLFVGVVKEEVELISINVSVHLVEVHAGAGDTRDEERGDRDAVESWAFGIGVRGGGGLVGVRVGVGRICKR